MVQKSKKPKQESALDRLNPGEIKTVLYSLLKSHPDLAKEANELAVSLVSSTDADSVAADVELLASSVDVEEIYDRSGDHGLGYVDTGEAAWEILDEELQPIFDDLERNIELGFKKPATDICAGIVLGLHAVRNDDSDGAIAWAPDYPEETARRAVSMLMERTKGKTWVLPKGFIEQIPDWSKMISRLQAKKRERR